MIKFLFLLTISAALSEKPIRGRPFSRPLFLRQEEAPVDSAPYQPSGWKPEGQRLILPARQEAGVPHTVYGPPSSEAPPSEYGPPAPAEAEQTEPPQYPPNNEYGPPDTPQEPNNAYGPPDQNQPEPLEPQQTEEYPPLGGPPGESSNGGYDYPPPQQPFPDPSNEYGPPQSQPDNEYGPPQSQPQPDNEYGAPPQQPDNGYGPPPQENGQIPVDQGASEQIRQQQFRQQLPGFTPSRFVKPQAQRLRQNSRGQAAPEKLQQLPRNNQKQQFRQQSNRRPQNQQPQFQRQRVQPQQQQFQRQKQNLAQTQQFAQKQQLYQTPQSTVSQLLNSMYKMFNWQQ